MITAFIRKLLPQRRRADAASSAPPAPPKFGVRQDVGPDVHGIAPQRVDRRALEVVRTLKAAGYEAYIVGGAVRDLLLGLAPKDFDVATNATPEEVKALFRRAFIIGRRFRIVHVVFGRGREHEVVEVSTFRAYLDPSAAETVHGNERTAKGQLAGKQHAVDASGRVLRDNVWGPMEEDAARRDFSVNAMYYDPETQTVVDYHGGIADARQRRLRMIGDAASRYREDPVRIIRAVRFAAKLSKLGFGLDEATRAPLKACLPLLADVPQSRLFDEMLKLLQTGHALASIAQLRELGLQQGIYPLLDLTVARADDPLVAAVLRDTDRRVAEGKSVAPSFLLATVLWSDVRQAWQRGLEPRPGQERPVPPVQALQEAVDAVFEARVGDVSGRGKLAADMREIWLMQPRFEKRVGRAPFGLLEQPRFRAGYDFLCLRARAGEVPEELAHWWETFSLADETHRQDMVEAVRLQQRRSASPAGSRKPRVHRAPAGEAPSDSDSNRGFPQDSVAIQATENEVTRTPTEGALEPAAGQADAPARRRRRRRRKPSGGDAPPAAADDAAAS